MSCNVSGPNPAAAVWHWPTSSSRWQPFCAQPVHRLTTLCLRQSRNTGAEDAEQLGPALCRTAAGPGSQPTGRPLHSLCTWQQLSLTRAARSTGGTREQGQALLNFANSISNFRAVVKAKNWLGWTNDTIDVPCGWPGVSCPNQQLWLILTTLSLVGGTLGCRRCQSCGCSSSRCLPAGLLACWSLQGCQYVLPMAM